MGNSAFKGDDRYAFNVVDVRPQSPGQRCGLMPFHDFILSVNGNMLNNMDKDEIVAFINVSASTTPTTPAFVLQCAKQMNLRLDDFYLCCFQLSVRRRSQKTRT